MSTNTYIIIAVVVIIVLGGFLFFQSRNTPEQAILKVSSTLPSGSEEEQSSSVTVTYTNFGYSPREVTISQGETVTFQNESSEEMWAATAIHPTHTIYPGSDIQKCDTQEESRIFDACRSIAPGGSWSFVFQVQGNWGYHNHLNVSHTGKITVQ